jgi:hypothetical protein
MMMTRGKRRRGQERDEIKTRSKRVTPEMMTAEERDINETRFRQVRREQNTNATKNRAL